MTVTPSHAIDITSLPDLDAVVACDWGAGCDCHPDCEHPALWRVRFHGARNNDDTRCRNFTMLLCSQHLSTARSNIANQIRINWPGCCVCGKQIHTISDVLTSVVAL